MQPILTGGCQCGAIRYSINKLLPPAYACHCGECKKQSASAFSLSIPMQYQDLNIDGETKFFETKSYSGKPKYNYFCGQCGTRVWHSGNNPPDDITLKVGTLDDSYAIAPQGHLWLSKKQAGIMIDPSRDQHQTQPKDVGAWRANLVKRS